MNKARQMSEALQGCSILLPVDRRSNEFATALQRHGAETTVAPPLTITSHFDDAELLEKSSQFLDSPPDVLVVTTGAGFRGWMDAAEQAGLQERLIATLEQSQILVRGPKARGAVQQAGLKIDWMAESETSSEITAHLLTLGIEGLHVVIQHHGEDDEPMEQQLTDAGANVNGLTVYRWGPPADPELVDRTTSMVATGNMDAVLFTSAPSVRAWLHTAERMGNLHAIQEVARNRTLFGAVGPITAGPLIDRGIVPSIPERFRLGALVRETVKRLAGPNTAISTAFGPLHVRTGGVLLNDEFFPLSRTGSALLQTLADRPGQVLSRSQIGTELAANTPNGNVDGDIREVTTDRAVEVTIARIRSALEVPDLIQTVYKRGYRLAMNDYE